MPAARSASVSALPRFRVLRAGLAVALLAAAPLVVAAAAGNAPAAGAPAPQLRADPARHDFGRVPQGQVARHAFTLTNTGTAPLEILSVQPSCGCTTTDAWTHTIAPGQSGTIPFAMETATFAGPVTKTITVLSNDPVHPRTVLEFTAFVWTPVQLSQSVVIFPALTTPDQVLTRTVTIRLDAEGSLRLSDLRSDRPQFKPALRETIPGREFELSVTTVPPLAAGPNTARITLATSHPSMPRLAIQAVATVLPAVQVAPGEIVLPAEKLAAPEKRYVVLLNHRGGDLQVSDLRVNAPGVEIASTTTPDRKQITVTLVFASGFAADEPLALSGRTNHPDVPAFSVPIVVRPAAK